MNLQTASIKQLLEAERIALKYSPTFALMIAKEYQSRITS